jgi:hypothetical protein
MGSLGFSSLYHFFDPLSYQVGRPEEEGEKVGSVKHMMVKEGKKN